MKKFINFISSMKVALGILGILLVACTAGSLIPQNQVVSYYEETYGAMSGMILALGLDDVFHCGWFVVLTVLLVINLLACNLIHFPSLTKRMRVEFNWENGIHRKCDAVMENDPKVLFEKMGFRKVETHEKEGVTVIYGVRNKLGIWGPWLTHLGMLVVIVGFALGQLLQESYTAYGVAGETRSIEGTNIAFDINSFDVLLREDDTVEQYLSNITVHN
ncbi:MAG: cytochrome c biogenesis protein ResB, partial [Erysipelotrichaceae bacterium]|nr:cytochrome c biogenesis protein ResB [Erysipelotrichaceae bacterium]